MKRNTIGFQEMKEVMKYLGMMENLINLTMSTKKWNSLFETINENTFSLTEKTVQFFPNIHTLHLFKKEDQKLITHSIQQYVYWYPISYKQYKSENNFFKRDKIFSTKSVEFKSVIYKKEDREEFFDGENKIPKCVQEIGENCFGEVEELEEIDIPNTILRLGNNCFYWCYGLESIIIPNSITSIGDNCFACCESLESIQISSSVKTIGNKCFKHCWMLTQITIPDSVVSIGNKCFSHCKNLNEVQLSNNLTSVGFGCFEKCSKLTRIIASSDWRNEGNKLFNTKPHLCSLELPSSVVYLNNRRIKVVDLIVYKIPSNVTSLSNYCFSRCHKIKKLIIPPTVKSIGNYCFNDCPQLKEIILSSLIYSFGNCCFHNCGINTNKLFNQLIEKNMKESIELTNDQLTTIEEWSGKSFSTILFDSIVDNYDMKTSVFDKLLLNKSQLLIIIKTEKNVCFGCYINGTIDKIRNWISSTNGFVFTFNEEKKLKFDLKENKQDQMIYIYPSKCHGQLMKIGYHDIVISKDNSSSTIYQNYDSSFDYNEMSNAILGISGRDCFTVKRLIVCQMK